MIPAAASLTTALRKPGSNPRKPWRDANHMTSTRLSQAPIEVASASPTCASDPISATLQATTPVTLTIAPVDRSKTPAMMQIVSPIASRPSAAH